ncbi:multicopper oxidase family protein [Streptomyces fimicarius]|uniref:multicopper oxidase family protein n=1 Tax=Streptomyces griseus TaxID=1911 RepID=UPI0036E81C36
MPARRTDSAARPTRRRILFATGGVVLAASAGWGGNWLAAYKRHARSNVGTLGFRNRLRIPELLDPRASGGGARRYELELAPGSSEFLSGRKTATWGADGPYLAPTLRMRDGDPGALTVRNALPEPTTLHWHGMHLPPAMDGGPHQMVAPGAVWRPRWTVHQPASTLWYHPHPHGSTGSHVYRGIAGMIIVDDAASDRSGLPSAYGVDDIPLVLQDKNFHDDGALDFTESTFADTLAGVDSLGLLGDTILVNGTHDPHFEVTTERVRLRLLNGSNARVYELGFPGDRFAGGDDTFDLLELRAAPRLDPSPPLPTRIDGAPAAIPLPGTTTVRLAVRFDTLTDERIPYMYHCHVLRHEDDGMMGQFLVVAPGREDKVSRTLDAPGAHGGSHGSHR